MIYEIGFLDGWDLKYKVKVVEAENRDDAIEKVLDQVNPDRSFETSVVSVCENVEDITVGGDSARILGRGKYSVCIELSICEPIIEQTLDEAIADKIADFGAEVLNIGEYKEEDE